MTTVVLNPLRKQGDVSKLPAAPTAVLLQGSSAPPTATLPRTQGSSTSPTATLACTQGLGTSLPDTLVHSYTPIVHLDSLLASIKGRSRALMREGRAGGRADEQAHSRAFVTPTMSASPRRRITRVAFPPPCVPSRANPSGLGHAATILLVGPGTPRGRNADRLLPSVAFSPFLPPSLPPPFFPGVRNSFSGMASRASGAAQPGTVAPGVAPSCSLPASWCPGSPAPACSVPVRAALARVVTF
jgi:hypothetical protein